MSNADVAVVRDWLKKQKHLPQDVDDNYIKTFIAAAKGSLPKAKSKFEKFHILRHLMQREKLNWDPFSLEMGGPDKIAIVKLPRKSPEGFTIYVTKFLDCNDENGEPDGRYIIKYFARLMVTLLCDLWDNELGDCQMLMITDWTGLKLANFKAATPAILSEFSSAMTGGVPLRVKGTHEIGISATLEFILKTINTLLPKKLRQRRFAHSKIETMHQYIPEEYLPADYGGKQPSVAELHEQQKQVYKKHLAKLVDQKRQAEAEKPFVPAEFNVGSYDTFKKMDID